MSFHCPLHCSCISSPFSVMGKFPTQPFLGCVYSLYTCTTKSADLSASTWRADKLRNRVFCIAHVMWNGLPLARCIFIPIESACSRPHSASLHFLRSHLFMTALTTFPLLDNLGSKQGLDMLNYPVHWVYFSTSHASYLWVYTFYCTTHTRARARADEPFLIFIR